MTHPRYDRQSFLGADSDRILANAHIGIVGLGGGGSHLVQQLSHAGICHITAYDGDRIDAEGSNLNRTVGAREGDVTAQTLKIDVARRLFAGLHGGGVFQGYSCRWQENPLPLRACDLVFGCVDSIAERHQLEAACRRFLMPYIDLGMDVNAQEHPPRMYGQVILSMPGDLCLQCLGFVEQHAQPVYGDAGGRPQVIWPNGVLASVAVGLAMELLTDWTTSLRGSQYLVYDGNARTVNEDRRMPYRRQHKCPHYSGTDIGDPIY